MTTYSVLYRSLDPATDGVYKDGRLVVSARTLWRSGYELERVLFWSQKALARLVEELER
jgi:hypothetical protein